MAMAKMYSVRYYITVLEKMRTTKAGAAMYIDDITTRGTSNTAEQVNSMFNAAQDLPWMDAFENIIDMMIYVLAGKI